MTTELK